MNCEICFEKFDHTINKPFSLSSCPHIYCLSCLDKLENNKCPACKTVYKSKNPNNALLKLIPESNYDKLKSEALKSLIKVKELRQNLKLSREEKLISHQTSIKRFDC